MRSKSLANRIQIFEAEINWVGEEMFVPCDTAIHVISMQMQETGEMQLLQGRVYATGSFVGARGEDAKENEKDAR